MSPEQPYVYRLLFQSGIPGFETRDKNELKPN